MLNTTLIVQEPDGFEAVNDMVSSLFCEIDRVPHKDVLASQAWINSPEYENFVLMNDEYGSKESVSRYRAAFAVLVNLSADRFWSDEAFIETVSVDVRKRVLVAIYEAGNPLSGDELQAIYPHAFWPFSDIEKEGLAEINPATKTLSLTDAGIKAATEAEKSGL